MDRNLFACECRDSGHTGTMLIVFLLIGALAGLGALYTEEVAQGAYSLFSLLAQR